MFEVHTEAAAATPAPGTGSPRCGAGEAGAGSQLGGSGRGGGRGQEQQARLSLSLSPLARRAQEVAGPGVGGIPRGGGAGRRGWEGTKVLVPGRQWNTGRRKPPGKAEPGAEPGLKVDRGPRQCWASRPRCALHPPGTGVSDPALASPGAAKCSRDGGSLPAGGLACPLPGAETPKPSLISGMVLSGAEL